MIKLKTKAEIKTDGLITNITIPIGEKYLSNVIEYIPSNVILNKGVTGCGGTFLEIMSKRHSIIVVPFRSLILNKKEQHDKKGDANIIPVCGGFSFTKNTVNEINTVKSRGEYVKIMTTYDSLSKVYGYLKKYSTVEDFFVLVDEWHILFNSYSFREDAIQTVYNTAKLLPNVTYMTATPIRAEFIPHQLEDMPVVNLTWKDNARVMVDKIATNKPIHIATNIAMEFIEGKQFGNAHFFINSVRDIVRIINTIKDKSSKELTNEDFKVVCAKGSKNQQTLGDIENTTDLLIPKKINFYTSTVFEGSDIFDEEGKIFIVSSGSSASLRLDIATSFTQIVGRIRNSKYATNITHICSTLNKGDLSSETVGYDEYCEIIKPRIEKTKKRIMQYNSNDEDYRREIGFETRGKMTDFYTYNEYTDTVEYDVNKERYAASQHYILTEIYSSGFKLNRSLKDAGYVINNDEYEFVSDKLKLSKNKRVSFKELYIEYIALLNSDDVGDKQDRIDILLEVQPILEDAHSLLGDSEVCNLEYGTSRIKRAINKAHKKRFKNNTQMIASKSILSSFKSGKTYVVKDVLKTISDIYVSLDIRDINNEKNKGDIKVFAKAKTSVLKHYFDVQESSMRINGKVTKIIKLK